MKIFSFCLLIFLPAFFCGCSYFDYAYLLFSPAKLAAAPTPATPKSQQISTTPKSQQAKKSTPLAKDTPKSQHAEKSSPLAKIPFRRIAFVGDSHIASDFMSDIFRKKLSIQSLGMLPPVLPKYHRQTLAKYRQNASIRYLINHKELAFPGINAYCESACEIDILLGFLPTKASAIINGKKQNLARSKNLKITAKKGDLITAITTANAEYIDNLGINGASVYNYFRINDFSSLIDYDLVIFSFGTNESVAASVNEASLRAKMREIFGRFGAAKKLLLLPPEPVIYEQGTYKKGKSTQAVFRALKAAANDAGVAVFDINALMQSEGGRKAWRARGLAQANTHLSARGYYYVAEKLLGFLAQKRW